MIADKYQAYRKDVNFIKKYMKAVNAASGSEVDANSNVSSKNIATMAPEIHKKDNIYANRLWMHDRITELYGKELADEYIRQLEDHEIYRHDETLPIGTPYCASITLYPFVVHGMTTLCGTSKPPHHLRSFLGGFINLVFAVSSELCGAVATPEFLTYMDYFIRKEYGNEYYLHPDEIVNSYSKETIRDVITQGFEQVVYSLNQPAGSRGFQSVFWNLAYFDKDYFNSLFDGFAFPDGESMQWESVSWLQKYFMDWFNKERLKSVLTFPVESLSLLNDGTEFTDEEWFDYTAEMYAKGHSFFTYTSDSVDSLASCCRLRNGITENTFSYTLGAGGIATGSKCVMTININRLVQNRIREDFRDDSVDLDEVRNESNFGQNLKEISQAVSDQVDKIHKYLLAFNSILMEMCNNHMIPVYDAGFVSPEKQYLTIGINGAVEAAEFLGIEINDNEKYRRFMNAILEPIYEANKQAKTKDVMFNTEFVPAENLGIKNAAWDKKDGYFVPRDCYNSYFYIVEDETTSPVDKIVLHGKNFTSKLDGGSACHINLQEHLSKEQYKFLLKLAIKQGTPYLTFNIPNTVCNDCGYISKHMLNVCPKCRSENLDYATRIIGYLTRVSKWSIERQHEHDRRYYAADVM